MLQRSVRGRPRYAPLTVQSVVDGSSVVVVQIFDRSKFRRHDPGCLGVVNLHISSALDLGDGVQVYPLEQANEYLAVSGTLALHLSTDTSEQLYNAPPADVSQAAVAIAAAAGWSAWTSDNRSSDAASDVGSDTGAAGSDGSDAASRGSSATGPSRPDSGYCASPPTSPPTSPPRRPRPARPSLTLVAIYSSSG